MKFTIIHSDGTERELMSGGNEIAVTSENVQQYCLAAAKYYLLT
jgi:hypothetical protein